MKSVYFHLKMMGNKSKCWCILKQIFFIFMIIGLSPAYILNSAFVKTKQIKCESYLFVIWSGVKSSSCPQHCDPPLPSLYRFVDAESFTVAKHNILRGRLLNAASFDVHCSFHPSHLSLSPEPPPSQCSRVKLFLLSPGNSLTGSLTADLCCRRFHNRFSQSWRMPLLRHI